MRLRPYQHQPYELPIIALVIAASVWIVLAYAGCHVDNKPRVSTWSPYQPPVVVHAQADEDGGPR